jgi:hypothetical protein
MRLYLFVRVPLCACLCMYVCVWVRRECLTPSGGRYVLDASGAKLETVWRAAAYNYSEEGKKRFERLAERAEVCGARGMW